MLPALSFVIDSDDPNVGTSGARRGWVLSLVDELVSVRSLLVEAIGGIGPRKLGLGLPWITRARLVGLEQGS